MRSLYFSVFFMNDYVFAIQDKTLIVQKLEINI